VVPRHAPSAAPRVPSRAPRSTPTTGTVVSISGTQLVVAALGFLGVVTALAFAYYG
jgi:hypothetical protein